ncbi:cytochrome P450 [Xylariaceae sp. FL0255]|nr:cytochrome P450 [Xylariaceae sp. FL0255]
MDMRVPFSSSSLGLLALIAATTLLLVAFIQRATAKRRALDNFPLVNTPAWYDVFGLRAKLSFVLSARDLLAQGVRSGKPFRLLTDLGEMIVLPSKYANEIRSDPRLSFAEVIEQNFHAELPGFEGFRQGTTDARLTRDIANKQLTHSLAGVTEALSEEAESSLSALFPPSKDWTEVDLREKVLQLIARLSSRVFLGMEGPKNDAWIKITTDYTKEAYIAAYILRLWPRRIRPFAQWFLLPCRNLRVQVDKARRIVDDIVARRRESKSSESGNTFNDAIAWFEQDTKDQNGGYDPVVAQLVLAQAAIETTTDLLTQTILDIATYSDVLVEPLRAEIQGVLGEAGWKKSSLYDMKLLDSVLKESQRLKPLAMTSMHRLVLADITLSDGLLLPKGSVIGVSGDRMWEDTVHENASQFDGFRFYNRRSIPGSIGNQAHFVSTGVDHLAFGHGKHACAGRFFVAHEAKIVLSHMLLKYDWKIDTASAASTKPINFGLTMMANPKAKIVIRQREV